MGEVSFEQQISESLDEWADIQKKMAEREKKDKKIISRFCANNTAADIGHILELLLKYDGMSGDDKKSIEEFKSSYPNKLTIPMLGDFLDIKDIYKEFLESGGENDD